MDKKEVFKKFVLESEVLVVDKNPGSRNRLLKILCDLGAKRHMVHTASGLVEANGILKEKKISLVLSDYMVVGGSGFDLFKMLREQQPQNKDLCLILVTSNISQTAVAKAAEEDVDSFIIKPYTLQSIQENLISAVSAKIQPSTYMLKIQEAKVLIQNVELDKAEVILKEAMSLHKKPALALFYMGQIEYMRTLTDEARGNYEEGLSFNTIHFKCLIGLYDLFVKEQKFVEAYQVVKKVSKYFPANPDRLTQIVRLAIQTENYKDMQSYYEIFISLDERTPLLMNYMGAGLFVSGKYLINNNEAETAMKYFDNIAVSCSEFTKFTRATITLLVEKNRVDEAQKFLSRFPAGSKEDEDYLVSDYLIDSKMNLDPHTLVKKGMELYNLKIREAVCMNVLLHAMERSGLSEEKITKYRAEFATLSNEKSAA
jgi:CheY-like chemotaxis protein